ncbi:MAG TPA: HAMP domain-containing sensor histidine kinase [Streptosporangiaceae bacterium]|jgi:two-component system OmpR family sensor kinase|nr:HAMP domain-containing sensor histidine kinase [Streptosporangiaceae bacterium]
MAPGTTLGSRISRPWGPLIRGSLTARLVASLVALVIVTCAVLGFATYAVLSKQLMASFNQQLQDATSRAYATCGDTAPPQTSTSAYRGSKPDGDGDSANCGANIQGQSAGTFDAWLTVSGSVTQPIIIDGKCDLSAADTATLEALKVYTEPAPPSSSNAPGHRTMPAAPVYTRTLSSLGGDYKLTAVRRSPNGNVLLTGLPLHGVQHTLRNVEIAEIAVFAVVVALVAGTGAGLVRFSLRPLRRVAATATMVTELPLDTGEVSLAARVPDDDPRTEVGRVGAAFNRMLQHVESALANRAASETRLRRFAADASHELRTPLSAIRGYAELALRQGGPIPEDVTHALERVQSESARMSVLVDELLLLARLDAGRPLATEPVDLTMLTIEATSDARVASPSHRWRLELPDEPLAVRGDELRLRQVLSNLLSNAAKHTPAESEITVGVAATDYVAGPDAGTGSGRGPGVPAVQLTVTDDGPGIPADLLPELFERFVRGDSSRSHAAGSTGLGLAIVKAVVTAHQGTVGVTSRPGRTSFRIILPRLRDDGARPADGDETG